MKYPFPQTDRETASKQLAYLGYTANQVYLRFFYHSKDKRKDTDKGRKLSNLEWQTIESYQQQGRGVYLVANGNSGGHEDKDIKQCAAIFCEWDDRPIEDQLLHWETVGFFEPTFTVYSGDKSAQPYWVFDTPISVEEWRELQRMLIKVMGADPINKNPSRVFRLAGGWHVKPGREPKRTEIIQESGQKYSYHTIKTSLETLLKKQSAPPLTSINVRYEDIKLPIQQTVPLETCLSKDSRNLLECGSAYGERNANGAKLARDLIGTASYLEKLGQAFAGDPWHLFIEYCHRCPLGNGWNESEWQSIWNSAQNKNPAPSCTPNGVDNCLRAWYWKNYLKNNTFTGVGFSPKSKPSPSSMTLCDRISKILNSYDLESAQTAALMDLAGEAKKSFREIERLAQIVRKEGDLANEVVAAIDSFASILKNCRKRLDISHYLDPKLAKALIAKAEAMPTAPEYLFNTLLPACASRIGSSARIIVNPNGGYTQECIFWTANVAHSGQAKTPPQKEVIAPLEQMEAEAKEIYDANLTDYEQDKKSDGKPPTRMRRLLSNTTTSTKIRIHGENPRGLLEYIDELVADYQRLNQYKGGGKGDDLQLELSFFNGCACNYDRHDARLFLSRTAFSKTGTYQWDTLARLMSDDVNFISSGYSARFLYCSILDAPPRYLDLLSPRVDSNFSQTLQELYQKLETLPERDYLLSHEAKVQFQAWNHALADDEREENYYGFSLVYPKIEAYTARIALWLHIVNAVMRGDCPEVTISGETMQRAVEISSFYLWQQKLIHANNAPSRKLEGVFFKVQMQAEKYFAKSHQGLNASFFKTRINALKGWATEKIRTVVFKALVAAGHGQIQGEGSEMRYFPNSSSNYTSQQLANVGEEMVGSPIDKSTIAEAFQPTIGGIGDLSQAVDIHSPSLIPITLRELNTEQAALHQSTNKNDRPVTEEEVKAVDSTINSPPTSPTLSPEPAALLLQCKTWVEIAQKLQKDSQKLSKALQQISKEQKRTVASLLIDFLCVEPQHLKELSWLPAKMLTWILERLNFTISRVGGESIEDAQVEKLENLAFVSVERLGNSSECWIFCDRSSGKNIPVFDTENICAISVKT